MSRFLQKLVTASALAAGALAGTPSDLFADDPPKAKEGERKTEGGERKAEAGDDAPRPEIGDLFRKLDSDGDGKISGGDVPEEHKRLFERLVSENDKDKDGKLNLDEFRSGLAADRRRAEEGRRGPEGRGPEGRPQEGRGPEGREGGPSGPARGIEPAEMFKRIDRNGDGKITKDDAPPEAGERFQFFLGRMDADKDGSVTEEEFRKSYQRPGGSDGGPRDGQPREGNPGPNNPGQGGPRFGGMGFPGVPVLLAIDTNKDGEISADEITAASSELRKLDKDGDGKLSRQEIMPRFEGRPFGDGQPRDGQPREGRPDGQPGPQRVGGEFFKSRDTNGDGRISREEAPERLKENFERIDGNKDGYIDPSELGRMFGGQGRPDGERGPDARPAGKPDGEARREPGPEQREEIVRASNEKFKAADKNGDGKLTRDELPEQAREYFSKLDVNGDGVVGPDEMREAGRLMGRRDGERKPEGEVRRDGERKPEGEVRHDGDRKPEAKKEEVRKPRDGESPKKDEVKRDEPRREEAKKEEPRREERKKDDAPKKDDDVKKEGAKLDGDAPKKDDAPSK